MNQSVNVRNLPELGTPGQGGPNQRSGGQGGVGIGVVQGPGGAGQRWPEGGFAGNSHQGSSSIHISKGGTGGPMPHKTIKKKWRSPLAFMHDIVHAVFPLLVDPRKNPDEAEDTKARVDAQKHLERITTELNNARDSYCASLVEMARHRSEASYQLIRFNELEKIRKLIDGVDTKDFDTLRAELDAYATSNV